MKILKASAGSGKTFRLANSYVDLLLGSEDRYAYRHILAVTFTNKATAEMKARILKELGKRAKDEPRAEEILRDILHDYSAFSVSTIDKFFQTALKAFSREVGQFSSYQLELDRKSLVTEAMDRILDSLTEDKKELVEWIKECVKDKIEAGERFRFDDGLYEIGQQLKSEEFRKLSEEAGITPDYFSKEKLAGIHSACTAIIKDFTDRMPDYYNAREYDGSFKIPGVRLKAAHPELERLFDDSYSTYLTAFKIEKQLYSLGLAGEFLREFDELLKEKNLMCLDESNTILRDIIDGSDAPFIYEKLGVRYENFLLDEFQDTSNIQWENFLPLLRESEANGGKNLIVGDVKQSIYRFRDSDWELLNSKVCEEFPKDKPEELDCNWRSCRTIVNFNNDFFEYAANQVGVDAIYSDVRQKVKAEENQEGFVRVSFTDDQIEAVVQSVEEARSAGARWSDIAVLTRYKKEGSRIAAALINKGIPVISDDSLKLKSSLAVRRVISLLCSFDNPEDSIGRYLSSTLQIVWPEKYFSLTDLTEDLIRQLRSNDPASFEGETLFLQALLDDIQSWTATNGNNLTQYLKHWKDSDNCIGSPENSDSIRLITVHKAKGLEYPYLIFPFADTVSFYETETRWCRLESGLPGVSALNGIYPQALSSRSADTLFAKDFEKEQALQIVDNINIFYVALTRATKCLHVISKEPPKTLKDSLAKGKPKFNSFSGLLYAFIGGSSERSYGTMYDFSKMERRSDSITSGFPVEFTSIPLGKRLTPSAEAMDFFETEGESLALSPRREGILLHNILSQVRNGDDLREAVDSAVSDGIIDAKTGENAFALLSERIASHPEWFGKNAGLIYNEVTVVSEKGKCFRPDRVILKDGIVTIIDYKFGEEDETYLKQVRNYMDLYSRMGYETVRGAVWYVRENSVTSL